MIPKQKADNANWTELIRKLYIWTSDNICLGTDENMWNYSHIRIFPSALFLLFHLYKTFKEEKKNNLKSYSDIKYMLEILAMHCQEIEKQVENYFLKFVLSTNTY